MKKIPFKIRKGFIEPANKYAVQEMKSRNYSIDDIVFCVITKPRNPEFNSLVHVFGEMIANNVDRFKGLDSHVVLKSIQAEGNIACTPISINVPGHGMFIQNMPKSLSFESMKEEEFQKTYKRFCEHIAEIYWPDCTPEQIATMAEFMEDEI